MLFPIDAKHHKSIILYFIALLVIISRFLILKEFCFQYTGNDDLIFWHVAADYSKGIFHEPFFYGQNYNFAFESIISVPLIVMGVPIYIALPIMSSFIGVFPFFLFSIVLYRKGYTLNSYLFLLIPLTLPIEYDIITSITRGFTSGLFFSSFLIFPLLSPFKVKSFILLGLSVSFGYILNPNSLIISFPICLYLLFKNYNKPVFYLVGIAAAIPALLIEYVSKQFYVNHPEYIVHAMWKLDFKFDRLIDGLSNLDKFFRYLTPVFWAGNWLVLIIIFFLGIIIIKKSWEKGLSLLLSVLFIVVLLGLNKINDEIGVIFLSSTRMFLAIPLLLGLSVFWTKENFIDEKKWKTVILTIAISVFLVKISCYKPVIAQHTEKTNYGSVAIKNLDSLISECSDIQKITSKYEVDLVVFLPTWDLNVPTMAFYNYGCSILEENATSSIMNIYERRTWVFQEEKIKARKNVLLYNQNIENFEEYKKVLDCEVINKKPTIILIRNNDKNLLELSKIFNFKLQRYKY
jgi:hypothetical protein